MSERESPRMYARMYARINDVVYVLMLAPHRPLGQDKKPLPEFYGIPIVYWPAGGRQFDVWPLPREGCGLVLEGGW